MKKIVAILGIIIILISIFNMQAFADEENIQGEDISESAMESLDSIQVEESNEKTGEGLYDNKEKSPIDIKSICIYSSIIIAIFLIALIYILGLKSIRILLSNLVTGLIVWLFFTKGLMWGWNPILILVSTIGLLISFNLLLLKGANKKSLIAFMGCSCSALFTGLISVLLIFIAKQFGIGVEAISINNFGIFDFSYVYLSIIITIISSLGVCLEIGYSVSNYLFENKNSYDDMKLIDLIKESKKYAKTIVSSNLNVLLFNLLCIMNIIFIFIKITSIMRINEYEIYAQMMTLFVCEILGILFTLLFTAIAFWLLYSKRTKYRKSSTNIVDGKRSLKI